MKHTLTGLLLAVLVLLGTAQAGHGQSQLWINVGTANSTTGDTRFASFNKINTNFSTLFTNLLTPLLTNIDLTLTTTNGSLTNWWSWTPTTSTVVHVTGTVTACTTNDGGVGLSTWNIAQTFKMSAAGTTLTAATNNPTVYRQLDAFAAPWVAHLTNDSSSNVVLAVKGASDTNVAWRARLQAVSRRLQ